MADEQVDDSAEAGALAPAAEPTLDILRHSAAHLMAAAVVQLYPGAKYDVGPAIQDGFFYNFRLPDGRHFSEADLGAIEARMHELSAARIPFVGQEVSRAEARALFAAMGQDLKVDIIDRIAPEVEKVGVYRTGDFVDLCRGPHVADSGQLSATKLLRVAGVYWRGDEGNEQLQRIYGTAWFDQEDLDAYLQRLAEAERRDHRRLGRELDLFSLSDELGGGLVLWHARGGRMRIAMEDHWREAHRRGGYEQVFTPHIAQRGLWETSGHVDFFAENMFEPVMVEGRAFQLKPMNCPFHILIYRSRQRSYRELPVRLAELGTVYRYERSGVLHGLLRVRGFTQDDAHIFCRPDQIDAEIGGVIDFSLEMFRTFGFEDLGIYLSTRPDNFQGSLTDWDRAEAALAEQLLLRDLAYTVDPGAGTFYGPKIDIKVRDALDREWQCATIQFDFTEPENFGLEYVGADGARHRPVMVHRALLGSMERFMGVLIEHYEGKFPLWLAPTQVALIPVQDDRAEVMAHVHALAARLSAGGLRVEADERPGLRMQARIREAERLRVPYVVVVGMKDVERADDVITVRDTRRGGEAPLPVPELLARLSAEIGEKRPA